MNRPLPDGYQEVLSADAERLDEAGVDVVLQVKREVGSLLYAPTWCVDFVAHWHEARDLQYASIDLMVRAVRYLRRHPELREETAGAILTLLRLGGVTAVGNYLHDALDYAK